MARKINRKPVALGFLAVSLAAILLGHPHCLGDRTSGDEDRSITLAGHKYPVRAVAFSPDNTTLTSVACYLGATKTGVELAAWDVGSGKPVRECIEYPDAPHGLAFDPGGRMLAAAGQDQSLRLWYTGPQVWRWLGKSEALVFTIAFSSDGKHLATADCEGRVTLWEVASGRPRASFGRTVSALAFVPDGTALALGRSGCTTLLWDMVTQKDRGPFPGNAGRIGALAFSPDGRFLAVGDLDGVVKLWDVASRTERATLVASEEKVAEHGIAAMVFAPDGRTLVVAAGGVVQLWDVAASRLVAKLEGHEGRVNCLAYAPDGTRLASAGHDRTVRLWDVTRYRASEP
jgi:WD40 repeat protein